MLRTTALLEATKGALKGRLVHCNHEARGPRLGVGAWCFFGRSCGLSRKSASPLCRKNKKIGETELKRAGETQPSNGLEKLSVDGGPKLMQFTLGSILSTWNTAEEICARMPRERQRCVSRIWHDDGLSAYVSCPFVS